MLAATARPWQPAAILDHEKFKSAPGPARRALEILKMAEFKSLCVFCGSKVGDNPAYERAARRLGELMAARGVRLVYGGGRIGLMGAVAEAVAAGGGEVVGIIPEFLMRLEVGNAETGDLTVTDSMHTRKAKMFGMSDAVVVLPGGIGTMDETIEVMTWKQLRQHDKPIVVMNIDGYWDAFLALIDSIVSGGFAHPKIRELISVVDDAEAVFDALAQVPEPDQIVLTSHL